jgi:hypothetical protein
MDPLIRRSDVRDVVGDDGRHDAAERGADTAYHASVTAGREMQQNLSYPVISESYHRLVII